MTREPSGSSSPVALARPRSGGERRGAEEGGRSATPAPALLSYCATASPAPPGRTPQRALRTCRARAGPAPDPGSPPIAPGARRARRGRGLGEGTPGARGSPASAARGCHTWRAPASHPFPLTPGCAPCHLPPLSRAPKPQPSLPPIPSISVPNPPRPAPAVVTPGKEEGRMFVPWLKVTGESEDVNPEKSSPGISPAGQQRRRLPG